MWKWPLHFCRLPGIAGKSPCFGNSHLALTGLGVREPALLGLRLCTVERLAKALAPQEGGPDLATLEPMQSWAGLGS